MPKSIVVWHRNNYAGKVIPHLYDLWKSRGIKRDILVIGMSETDSYIAFLTWKGGHQDAKLKASYCERII